MKKFPGDKLVKKKINISQNILQYVKFCRIEMFSW